MDSTGLAGPEGPYLKEIAQLEEEFKVTECSSKDRWQINAEFQAALVSARATLHSSGMAYKAWVSAMSTKLSEMRTVVLQAKRDQERFEREQITVHNQVESVYAKMRQTDELNKDVLAITAEYGRAVGRGVTAGLEAVGEIVRHPIDTLVTPITDFVDDTGVLLADVCATSLAQAYKPADTDRATPRFQVDKQRGDRAEEVMYKRWTEAKATAQAFAEGSGPDRVEMATHFLTVGAITKQVVGAAGSTVRKVGKAFKEGLVVDGTCYDPNLVRSMKVLDSIPVDATEAMWDAAAEKLSPALPTIKRMINASEPLKTEMLSSNTTYLKFQHNGVVHEVFEKNGYVHEIPGEARRLNLMRKSLKHGTAPEVLGFSYSHDHGTMYLSRLPGVTFAELLESGSEGTIQQACYQLGLVLGELDQLQPLALSVENKASKVRILRGSYEYVASELDGRYGRKFKYSSVEIEKLITEFEKEEVVCGVSHHDPGLTNFLYDERSNKVGVIDAGAERYARGDPHTAILPGESFYELQGDIQRLKTSNPKLAESLSSALSRGYNTTGIIPPVQEEFTRVLIELVQMERLLDGVRSLRELKLADYAHMLKPRKK